MFEFLGQKKSMKTTTSPSSTRTMIKEQEGQLGFSVN